MKPIILFLGILAMQTPPAPSAPMPDPKSATVPRMEAAVKIDGLLDEPAWQKAARLTPFVHHDTMAPARVATEARIWYDPVALYVGGKKCLVPPTEDGYKSDGYVRYSEKEPDATWVWAISPVS